MAGWNVDKGRLLTSIVLLVSGQIVLLAGMRWLLQAMEPNRKQKDAAAAASQRVVARLQYVKKYFKFKSQPFTHVGLLTQSLLLTKLIIYN